MKAIATFVFVLLIGFTAQAQDAGKKISEGQTNDTEKLQVEIRDAQQVARLYRHKFAEVKKELSFATKNTQSKLV